MSSDSPHAGIAVAGVPDRQEEPLVSVIIPTYNGACFLAQTIESVLAQTYPSLEVLVVDDGSTDATWAITAGYGPRVRYVRQANAGTAAARNRGVAEARGQYIALLDHDDLWLPHKLERQLPVFADDPAIGVVFAGIEFFRTRTGEVTAQYFPGLELGPHDLLAHRVLPIQTVVFRRSALDAVGPFDVGLRGTDDWDLGIRLSTQFRMVGVPETLARVRLHPDQQGGNSLSMYRQALLVLEKHRTLHPHCRACREAWTASRRILHADFAAVRRGQARDAWREKRYATALEHTAAAVWHEPALIYRRLRRALSTRPMVRLAGQSLSPH